MCVRAHTPPCSFGMGADLGHPAWIYTFKNKMVLSCPERCFTCTECRAVNCVPLRAGCSLEVEQTLSVLPARFLLVFCRLDLTESRLQPTLGL